SRIRRGQTKRPTFEPCPTNSTTCRSLSLFPPLRQTRRRNEVRFHVGLPVASRMEVAPRILVSLAIRAVLCAPLQADRLGDEPIEVIRPMADDPELTDGDYPHDETLERIRKASPREALELAERAWHWEGGARRTLRTEEL